MQFIEAGAETRGLQWRCRWFCYTRSLQHENDWYSRQAPFLNLTFPTSLEHAPATRQAPLSSIDSVNINLFVVDIGVIRGRAVHTQKLSRSRSGSAKDLDIVTFVMSDGLQTTPVPGINNPLSL
jgi:hypothetical protein